MKRQFILINPPSSSGKRPEMKKAAVRVNSFEVFQLDDSKRKRRMLVFIKQMPNARFPASKWLMSPV